MRGRGSEGKGEREEGEGRGRSAQVSFSVQVSVCRISSQFPYLLRLFFYLFISFFFVCNLHLVCISFLSFGFSPLIVFILFSPCYLGCLFFVSEYVGFVCLAV